MSEPSNSGAAQPKPRKATGGYRYHKPGCGCIACRAARKRAEAALLGGPGIPTKAEITEITGRAPRTTGLLRGEDAPYSTANRAQRSVLDADVPFKINARTQRDRVAQWISLKTMNPQMTNAEIAKQLGLAPNTLSSIISRARREGWLTFSNPLDVIEHDLIPKTLDNINRRLDDGDKDVTIEAMKGFIVPQWKAARGITEDRVTVLALKIEMPEGDPAAVPRGTISGTPRLTLPDLADQVIDVEVNPSDS